MSTTTVRDQTTSADPMPDQRAEKPTAVKRRKSEDEAFRADVAVLLMGAIALGLLAYGIFVVATSSSKELHDLIVAHPAQSIGIPAAALIALFLVIFLEYTSGESLKFKGMGFEFQGAAGPILFWVICFAVIVLAIQLLRWLPAK